MTFMNSNENPPILSIVIPCYNEEEALPVTIKRLNELFLLLIHEKISDKSMMIFIR